MAILNRLLMHLGGGNGRTKGLQYGAPGSYQHEAATNVTVDTALQLSAVWACTRLITESLSSLPINVYKLSDGGVETPFRDHRLAMLFRGKVNRWQTRQEWLETCIYQYVLQGNNYNAVVRNSQKDIVSLIPLMTPQMQVELLDDGAISYQYTDDKGLRVYSQKSIFHNKLFGNGIIGMSPLAYARNSVGVGQAAEKAVTKVYKNGGKPSGLLMIDRMLKPEQRAKIKENFSELTEGNDDRLFVLESDMKYEQVSLSPQDIELLASRRFQIEDICRFFGVPSILVNDNHDNTGWGTGIGEIIQGFYKFGLRPYATRMQSNMECNLLNPLERDTMRIKFDFEALLQPEMEKRIKTGKEAVTGALQTPNEFRNSMGWPDVEGGDTLYMQQQMTPIDQLENILRKKQTDAES